jgi:hypothetical protein
MADDTVSCGECDEPLPATHDKADSPRTPCPKCGSTKRTFHVTVTGSLVASTGLGAVADVLRANTASISGTTYIVDSKWAGEVKRRGVALTPEAALSAAQARPTAPAETLEFKTRPNASIGWPILLTVTPVEHLAFWACAAGLFVTLLLAVLIGLNIPKFP